MKKLYLVLAAVVSMTQLSFADPGTTSLVEECVDAPAPAWMLGSIEMYSSNKSKQAPVRLIRRNSREELRISSESSDDEELSSPKRSSSRARSSWSSWFADTVTTVTKFIAKAVKAVAKAARSWFGW